jgi:hypothetical protein
MQEKTEIKKGFQKNKVDESRTALYSLSRKAIRNENAKRNVAHYSAYRSQTAKLLQSICAKNLMLLLPSAVHQLAHFPIAKHEYVNEAPSTLIHELLEHDGVEQSRDVVSTCSSVLWSRTLTSLHSGCFSECILWPTAA